MATNPEFHRHSSVARPRDQPIIAPQQPLDQYRASSVWSSSALDAKKSTPAMEPRWAPPSAMGLTSMVPLDSKRSRKLKEPKDRKPSSSSRPGCGRRPTHEAPRSRDCAMLGAGLEMVSPQQSSENRPTRLPAAYSMAPRQTASMDYDLASVGSWSYGKSIIGGGKPSPTWSDCLPRVPSPPDTPRIPRLPTPELGPLPADFEFCHCHGDEACEDKINEAWYLSSQARVNSQVEAALAHIARAKLDRVV